MSDRRAPHLCILASAGSGKTFRLSSRFIELVHAGERPDRVLASTFTRLAAGEIRDRILGRLADAVLEEGRRRELGVSIGDPGLTAGAALDLLRRLVRGIHQLQIRTLDSFFAGIVHGFGLELGLPLDVRLIEEDFDASLRAEAIRDMLADPADTALVEVLRALTEGGGDRSVTSAIDGTVTALYGLYREADPAVWTHWTPRAPATVAELAEQIDALAATVPTIGHHAAAHRRDLKLARGAGHDDFDDWTAFVSKGLPPRIRDGGDFHGQPVEARVVAAYAPVIDHAKNVIWNHMAHRTRSTGDLLRRFHACYEAVKRRRRALTFSDLAACVVAAQETAAFAEICFRLDARLHHLLLDEFQDTSMNQWRAVAPVAMEVVADGTGERSMFCVGDVKQSIYGWREAVPEILSNLPRLLGEERPGELMPIEQLTQSYRSSEAVIDTVNVVFENVSRRQALGGAGDAAAFWDEHFRWHSTARTDLEGYVELRTVSKAEDQVNARLREAAELVRDLHAIDPTREIGVLVRKNDSVGRLLYELGPTRLAVPATGRGGGLLSDSAAVNALLDVLRLADHPDDSVAAFNVERSPLAEVTGLAGPGSRTERLQRRERASRDLRRMLLDRGYAATLQHLAAAVVGDVDARELRRIHQLIELAEQHDRDPKLRPAAFAAYAISGKVDDPSPSPVKVMNVHQSKGLEFDVVILPELESRFGDQHGELVAVERAGGAGPVTNVARWVSTKARSALPELSPIFDQHLMRMERESLCVLYVAMTRARRGLFMLVDPPKENQGTVPATAAGLLVEALAEDAARPEGGQTLYTCGDRGWLDRPGAEPPARGEEAAPAAAPIGFAAEAGDTAAVSAEAPSAHDHATGAITQAVRLIDPDATDAGEAVHRIFEDIEWLETWAADDAALDELVRRAVPGRDEAWRRDVIGLVRSSLETSAVRDVLSRGERAPERCRVWRELAFARPVPGGTQRGVIDRLAVDLHVSGAAERAVIIDFKTDDVRPGQAAGHAESHRRQLESYRAVVADMHDLAPERIAMVLLFVRCGEAVELPAVAPPPIVEPRSDARASRQMELFGDRGITTGG